ncbi:MAG TPA: sigma-70 family RNA polymerase sigma factor [Desulfosporosinus sp.]|nr:sigma-70 family RNA polymerase sigma factor [Desulfosporosinus sp.]
MEQVAELVRQARHGDEEAWQALIQNVYPSGLSQARMLLRDQDLAEDALQNALIKVYRYLPSLGKPTAFKAWFRKILMNEVFLILRIRQKETEGLDSGLVLDQSLSFDEQVTLKVEIFRALQILPFEQQQVFIEVDIRGETLQAVAEDNELALGTVKSRLFRARERLRKELQEWSGVKMIRERYTLGEKKGKGSWNMSEGLENQSLSEQFYDYLEETMPSQERANFEKEWLDKPDWVQELTRHKNFLTLLHTLTGRLTLSAQEIAEKVQQVSDQIQDYEMVQEQTFFEADGPRTLSSHLWFKRPGQYRVEASNPMFGETIMTIRGQEMLSWAKSSKQAQRVKFSREMKGRMGPNFADALKRMATDKNSRVLGTEYVEGRPALHIQFIEKVANMEDMNTHVWLDKATWMLLVTEQYNSEGKLVLRNFVRELKLNQGLPDSQFELEIPEGVEIKEEEREEIVPLQEISVEEASRRLAHPVYLHNNENQSVKHQWIHISAGQGALMSLYKKIGEPIGYLTLTQGNVPHHNFPSKVPIETVHFTFEESEVEGMYVTLDLGLVMNMIIWEYQGIYFTAGCNVSKEELLEWVRRLSR